jgi:nucleotide-binding universal stress UspA family protein
MTNANQPETRGKGGVNGDSQGTLLVAVDFSEDSREAVLWANREAEHLGCGLMILHVVHDPASSPGFYRHVEVDWLRPMADLARAMMDAFLKKIREEHPSLSALATAEAKLVTGLPASRIVEVAKSINAPLIVIGSRGRTGLTHILLGSVAERVVQLAPMPVVVVKGHEEGNGTAH